METLPREFGLHFQDIRKCNDSPLVECLNMMLLHPFEYVHVIEKSEYDKIKRELEILKSKESQFESTLKETMRVRDELKDHFLRLIEIVCQNYEGNYVEAFFNDLDSDNRILSFAIEMGWIKREQVVK